LNGKSDEKGEGEGCSCSWPGAGCIAGGITGGSAGGPAGGKGDGAIRGVMSASAAAIEIAEGGGASPAAAYEREV